MARSGVIALIGMAILGIAAGGVVWAIRTDPPSITDWSKDYDTTPKPPATSTATSGAPVADVPITYDLVSRAADSIPPGTLVEKTAPTGWTHLVIKSLPRLRETEKKDLAAMAVDKASWMFTGFLANVKKESAKDGGTYYRFDKAALGLGASAKGKDTILTADTGRKLGGDLGLFGGEILTKGYEIQRKAVLVFSGTSMGLLDTPVWFRCGEDNRLLRYRYAMLVDTATGKLDVMLWRLGIEDGKFNGLDEAVLLKPDTIDPAELVVDRKKVNRFGVPGDDAFAVDKMPAGKLMPIPDDLKKLASQTRFTADEARALDTGLRKLIR